MAIPLLRILLCFSIIPELTKTGNVELYFQISVDLKYNLYK